MKIITTHLHADFDCLASMVAARKMYPGATLVFPGSQEKNVRDYLAQTEFQIPYRRLRGLNTDQIRHLVIVDASTRERVGMFAALAEREDVSVHLFDHHVAARIDLPHELAVIRARGATVTIFCELFRERGITLTPSEATLMAMGLYEDTGSLTFSSVRPEDFDAARWLLGQGADLNAVSAHIRQELSAPQIDMLNTLLKNLEYNPIGGVTVAITTGSTPRYIGDLSTLAHKLMDMEIPNALFVLVRMADRIHLIARSRVEGVNVGLIAEAFGGGGHPAAASATIKDLTMPQAVHKLEATLAEVLEPVMTAKEMMIEKMVSVDAGAMIADAEKLMTRYAINGMPVVRDGTAMGLVTRQIIEKAIYHHMESNPVSDFMTTEFATVEPGTPVGVVEEIILGGRQKLAPVIDPESGRLVGLISRGMILNKLYGESLNRPPVKARSGKARRDPLRKDVSGLMKGMLPDRIFDLVRLAASVADECGYAAYVVGGIVRDLLLRVPNMDVDIVIEGDGIEFAHAFAARVNGKAHPHEKFKTAVVTLPDGFKVDVATARIEYYDSPAALPTVEMSAIRNDLYRRDFSINAMAIRLNGPKPNVLMDFFGGQADLKDHAIRVLHNLSFVEDPTRAFRAVRFEHRYGFILGKQTLSLLKSAVRHQLFNRLSGERLFTELMMILKERHPAGAMARMKELGLLRFIHPDLVYDSQTEKTMDQCDDLLAWYELTFPALPVRKWLTYLMALLDRLSDEKLENLDTRFESVRNIIGTITDNLYAARKAARSLGAPDEARPSQLYETFAPLTDEALLYLAAKAQSPHIRSCVTRFLNDLKDTRPLVTGDDVVSLGVPPSSRVGAIIRRVMAAQLDGEACNREEALMMARRLAAGEGEE